jgi:threonylcarbamoyladenosine tRNA methylthiotransferase MtaB
MRIKPLKTESDYKEALKEIERIFNAAPGTREGDRLDVLTTLVEAYEEKHFHIPLQSGSPKILRLMQRRYKASFYRNLIYRIKEKINNAGIGVDVIVGFPGETDEDFLTTYNFLKDLPISYLHVFTYSERPDTKAVKLDGRVDIYERKKRNSMLRILSEKKKNIFYYQMIENELEVLFENENHNGLMKGFSSNYVRVSSEFNPTLINKFSAVKIKSINEGLCEGNIVRLGLPILTFPPNLYKPKARQVELKNAIDLKAG